MSQIIKNQLKKLAIKYLNVSMRVAFPLLQKENCNLGPKRTALKCYALSGRFKIVIEGGPRLKSKTGERLRRKVFAEDPFGVPN